MSKIKLPAWLKDIKVNKPLLRTISPSHRKGSKNQKLFLKLLSEEPELEIMWMALKKRDDHYNSQLWFLNFHHDVEMSLARTRFSRHSKKQRKDYGNNISILSEKLANLLKKSDFDTGIYDAMNQETQLRLSRNLPGDVFREFLGPAELLENETANLSVSDFLMQVSEMAKTRSNRLDKTLTSNTINSDQVYYMRQLTKLMRQRFNTPMRNVVSTSTAIIFDNPIIDPAYVAKFAP